MEKIPCIEITKDSWSKIVHELKELGYQGTIEVSYIDKDYNILVIDAYDEIGRYANFTKHHIDDDRYLEKDVNKFLEKAAKLMKKEYKPKKNTFTIDDIKPGMVIELRNGSREIILCTKDNSIFSSGKNDYSLESFGVYNKDLTSNIDKVYDIVKVYSIKVFCKILDIFDTENLSIIWEKPKLQISMKEIANKFGVNENEIEIIDYGNK